MQGIKFSNTYLFKLHKLTNQLDKVFDQALRKSAGIGLSQFTLLMSVAEHQPVSQSKVAEVLELSPGAISRQVEIAAGKQWLKVQNNQQDRRGQILSLSPAGQAMVKNGLKVLERDVLGIFDEHNRQTGLMQHIDHLLNQLTKVRK